MDTGSFQWCPVKEQEAVGTNWNKGGALNTRHHFCAGQVMEYLHRLLTGCGISSLEIFSSLLGTLLRVSLLKQGVGPEGPSVPCPLQPFCDPVNISSVEKLLELSKSRCFLITSWQHSILWKIVISSLLQLAKQECTSQIKLLSWDSKGH